MNLYVGNLSYHLRENELLDAFSEFGEVASARIITDRETRRSRGFGFVEMPNDDEAKEAMAQLNEREFDGRPITIRVAEDREPRQDRPRRNFNDRKY